MPAHAVDLETKQQGQVWLLPPYSYSLHGEFVLPKVNVTLGSFLSFSNNQTPVGHS